MRGHEPLLAMRRRGLKPALVSIDLEPNPWRDWADWPEWTTTAQLEVGPAESIRLLDLRCLVGLSVWLSGRDGARVRAMFEACKAAGAARVIAFEQRLVRGFDLETVAAYDSAAETVEA